jgi:hypothetical protein
VRRKIEAQNATRSNAMERSKAVSFFGWAGCECLGAKELAGLENTVSLLLH